MGAGGRSGPNYFQNWERALIGAFLQRLWDVLISAVQAKLEELGIEEGSRVHFVVSGSGLLPLHAAVRADDGTYRYFAEDHSCSFAPHVEVRRDLRDRRPASGLLAVLDPGQDMPFSAVERTALSRFIPGAQSRVLEGSEATLEAVLKELVGKTYLHFVCHGYRNWLDGDDSGLYLAAGTELSARTIARLDLSSTELVVLSGCDTGTADFLHRADQWVGLAGSFLLAGATNVISSLWPVSDEATALLFEHFYDALLLQRCRDPSEALHKAQRWLRTASAEQMQLASRWQSIYERSEGRDERALKLARYFATRPKAVPFADPYYWASFVFVGRPADGLRG